MAWTVHLRGKSIAAALDNEDRTWIPVTWLAETLGLQIRRDDAAAAIYLDDPAPLPALPADPVGAGIQPWNPVHAPITSQPGQRSPQLYELVIRQFRVATNPRYAPGHQGKGETYCNIYVWDVTRAMGAPIPHWVDAEGEPAAIGGPGSLETDANGAIRWLRRHGPRYGWSRCTANIAQLAANEGRPAVVCWLNPGGIGHIAMVRPGALDPQRGNPVAQAGSANFDDGYMRDGFGWREAEVEWYQHA